MSSRDLDLTELLPSTVNVIAGESTYEVQTDIQPEMHKRIGDWMRVYAQNLLGESADAPSMDDFHGMVGEILGCPVDEAERLGFKVGFRLLTFLAEPLKKLSLATNPETPPLLERSPSPPPSTEPSA